MSDLPNKPESPAVHDVKKCSVCNSPWVADIERLYIECKKVSYIADLVKLSKQSISSHCEMVGLDKRRAENTTGMAAFALNSAFERGVFETLDADQAIKLLAHEDRKAGRIKDNSGPAGPPQVIFVGVPLIGGVIPDEVKKDAEVIAGKVVAETLPTLPPTFPPKEDENAE